MRCLDHSDRTADDTRMGVTETRLEHGSAGWNTSGTRVEHGWNTEPLVGARREHGSLVETKLEHAWAGWNTSGNGQSLNGQ